MKRNTLTVMTLLSVALSAAAEQGKPYTHRNYFDDPDEFRFAIIPDRFGADYRAKDGPVIANIDVTGVLNHDFVNQKNTKAMSGEIVDTELEYPPDAEVRRHMDELKARKADILSGRIPAPMPEAR